MKKLRGKSRRDKMGKIVYAYVVADLIHSGHVHALENAKALAGPDGKLIVGVLTDEATMEKKSAPILPFDERIRMVKALKCVDCVVTQRTYSPKDNLKAIQPDIHMESDSHVGNSYINELKEVFNGKIIMMPYFHGICSSKIKEKIKNIFKGDEKCETNTN